MESRYFVNSEGGVHGNKDLVTPMGRAAFVYLARRNEKYINQKTGKGKFQVTILFEKKNEAVIQQLKEIQDIGNDMREFYATKEYEKSGKKLQYPDFRKRAFDKMIDQPIFRDGDMAKYDGFAGHWYIIAKNDENSGPNGIKFSDNRLPEEFEAGQLVRAQVRLYVDKQGFAYNLRRIKLVKDDGFRFQGASAPDLLSGLDDAVEAVKDSPADDSLERHYERALSEQAGSDLNVL